MVQGGRIGSKSLIQNIMWLSCQSKGCRTKRILIITFAGLFALVVFAWLGSMASGGSPGLLSSLWRSFLPKPAEFRAGDAPLHSISPLLFEFEVNPPTPYCPFHKLPLETVEIPVVAVGLNTAPGDWRLFREAPYGRLRTSGRNTGAVEVKRCKECERITRRYEAYIEGR
jgi:hypothetical protein